ncbi:MAG: hypothetical protein UW60_C0032G0018 [Candidatus Woesebacteria bacterium GW2011_GWA2_44_33]|uniref:DUF1573 domain-containing protein n=2 Tax=Candidatus Woeseibacteriota TaxID=1752722 RepID=A0A0G1NAG4_9BACT|nr:MAG: hypothetical protein UW60_C0032G0018 [Candidatus Woesebacteria bacterium GW2011_GWA2_44_33]KKU17501.1 MAG: hypothetical protein UX25_C0008G0002 [Candidatus Woesebacteria bacterium GW2011_GWC2_45_9]
MKDTKVLIGIIVATIILLVGGVVLLSRGSSNQNQPTTEVLGVEINPVSYDLGEVPINAGIQEREYTIKNTTDKTMKLKKIATSCMCTTAAFQIGDKTTNFFGMEGHGDANPPVNIEIGAGQEGKVIVRFDPAAHGPQGTGPFDRMVWLTFSDPGGIKELTFNGTVVSE